MATRTITIALEAKVSGLVNGFKTASQAANDFGSKTAAFAEKNRESLEAVGNTGMVAGGVLVAGFGKAVATFASFDKAMSSVQAATHESAENMELLSEAAITAGADTAYSAEEAAGAIEELAKAGVSTNDILNGGLNGALSLAAAGALDVGEAAETAASAMTQFKLKGSDIPHIADLLAAGAGKAQGSVHDLGMALNQSGLIASQTGLTIEEATGGLAAFASAGLIGSDAGTSFKTMLQRLNPQSDAAATLMSDLGLSAYDSQGEFIGLSEYAGKLQEALKDMSSEQRNATMNTLFGSDAVRAAAVLYEQGAEGVQEWEDAVNSAGYAAETAALMQDNLAGDLEKLGGAFDTVFLKAGGVGNDGLRGIVQAAEDAVDALGKIPAPVLGTIGVLGGLTGGALLLGGAFFTLAPRVFETVGHMRDLRASAPDLTTKLGKVGKAAGIAAAGFVALSILKEINNELWAPTALGLERVTNAMVGAEESTANLDKAFSGADWANGNGHSRMTGTIEGIDGVGDALARMQQKNWNESFSSWGNDLMNVSDKWAALDEDIAAVDTTLSGYVSSGNAEAAGAAFKQIGEDAEASGGSVEVAAEQFPEYLDSLRKLATDAGVALGTTSGLTEEQELLNWAMGDTPPAMLAAAVASEETAAALGEVGGEAEAAVVPLEDIVEALFALGMISMSSRDSTAAFHQALRDMGVATSDAMNGLLGTGAILNQTATDFDLTTEAGAAANAAFQEIATAGMTDVEAKAREGMGQPELQANLQTTYESLINAANGMGIEGTAAEDLARKVLGVPDNVDINTWMSDAAKQMAGETDVALDGIPRQVDVTVSVSTWGVAAAMSGIAGIAAAAANIGSVSTPPATPWYAPKHDGAGSSGSFAAGGAVFGPGTGTSDTAGLFALSNGEHVLTAKEVQAMGGQKAVYDFRTQIKAGIPAYAGGGRVGREYSAPHGSASGGSASSGTTIEMPITINGATDVHAVRQAVVGDIQFLLQKNGVRLGN